MKKYDTADYYANGILAGDRFLLSQAITLVESTLPAHQALAQAILASCAAPLRPTIRLGITGVPGVGKSTFIEAFGQTVLAAGHRLAVLTIDPSSRLNRGSILGDKTRMQTLSNDLRAYIRPSAAGDSLGGVARKTREAILLCEAAGFGVVIVETVGVGQSETAVHDLTDFFLLLGLPNAGDDLQGMKRGIVEMCDWIAINKSDLHPQAAAQSRLQYSNALHLFAAKPSGWVANASTCSATTHEGVAALWQTLETYIATVRQNGFFWRNRREQTLFWLHESIKDALGTAFAQHPHIQAQMPLLAQAVVAGEVSVAQATQRLLQLFYDK